MAANKLEKEYPGTFGPNGGKSRALAIASIAWTLGSCVGPVMAGSLNEKFGYYVLNFVLGEHAQMSMICQVLTSHSRTECIFLCCCTVLSPKKGVNLGKVS